jgi:hypothetical protein
MDNLWYFGVVISDRFKTLIKNSNLPEHILAPVKIKFGEYIDKNYWFFCITETSLDIIDFNASYFFYPNDSYYQPNLYANSIFKLDSVDNLINEMHNKKYGIKLYSLKTKPNKNFDAILLGSLFNDVSPFFSDNIVNKAKALKFTNCIFTIISNINR